MADIVKEISDRAKDIIGVVDQSVEDKDLANRLKYEFMGTLVNALFTGKGSSVDTGNLCLFFVAIFKGSRETILAALFCCLEPYVKRRDNRGQSCPESNWELPDSIS